MGTLSEILDYKFFITRHRLMSEIKLLSLIFVNSLMDVMINKNVVILLLDNKVYISLWGCPTDAISVASSVMCKSMGILLKKHCFLDFSYYTSWTGNKIPLGAYIGNVLKPKDILSSLQKYLQLLF